MPQIYLEIQISCIILFPTEKYLPTSKQQIYNQTFGTLPIVAVGISGRYICIYVVFFVTINSGH